MTRNYSSQSGVALLMSLGILAILSILGVAFSTNMRLMERITRDFNYEQMARDIAEEGIERAIADLKEHARDNFIYSGLEIPSESFEDISGNIDGAYEVTVIDTASQINLNANIPNLANMLGNLDVPDENMTSGEANAIVNLKNNLESNGLKFLTKQQIRTAEFASGEPAINEGEYKAIKDYITVNGYKDENSDNRSAININTADKLVIEAILEPLVGVISDEAEDVARHLVEEIIDCEICGGTGLINGSSCPICAGDGKWGRPYKTWAEFDKMIDKAREHGHINTNTDRDRIKDNANPNRIKPSTYTTEFCFHSGGIYEITSTGTLTNENGQVVAQKTINAIVKIFDLWNQTTTQQFWGEDINNNYVLDTGEDINNNGVLDPSLVKVTGLDSCPVRANQDWNGTTYDTIPGSLKIGYWDDFTTRSDISPWVDVSGVQTNFQNNVADMPQWGQIILGKNDDPNDPNWEFSNCSITIKTMEMRDPPNDGKYSPNDTYDNIKETGWFYFRSQGIGNEDFCTQIYCYEKLNSSGDHVGFFTPTGSPLLYNITGDASYEWEPGEADQNWGSDAFYPTKTYRAVQHYEQNVHSLALYMISGDDTTQFGLPRISGNFSRNLNSGWIKLWTRTWAVLPDHGGTHWDNLRIISDTGEYTSLPSDQAYNQLVLPENVEWGTVWGTVTRTNPAITSADVDVQIAIPLGATPANFTNGMSINNLVANSRQIQYKLYFSSNYTANNKYSETPVLEDVWITYLPKTKILYWKEGE